MLSEACLQRTDARHSGLPSRGRAPMLAGGWRGRSPPSGASAAEAQPLGGLRDSKHPWGGRGWLVAQLTPTIPPQGAPRPGWSGASGAAAPLSTPWPPGRPAHQHSTGLARRPAATALSRSSAFGLPSVPRGDPSSPRRLRGAIRCGAARRDPSGLGARCPDGAPCAPSPPPKKLLVLRARRLKDRPGRSRG